MVRSSLARPASAFGPGGRPDGSAHGRHRPALGAPDRRTTQQLASATVQGRRPWPAVLSRRRVAR